MSTEGVGTGHGISQDRAQIGFASLRTVLGYRARVSCHPYRDFRLIWYGTMLIQLSFIRIGLTVIQFTQVYSDHKTNGLFAAERY